MFSKLFGPSRLNVEKRYELICPMGRGTMSKVYRAKDRKSGKILALKILDKEVLTKYNARFRGMNKPSEGEIAVSLKHPNIVEAFEYGLTTNEEDYLTMEFLDGMDLSVYVETQNETMQELRLAWMIQLGDGLKHIHDQGWIHRDFCPKNVMVTSSKRIKLIDFGLMVPNTDPFKAPGNRTGTMLYMAPELMNRKPTDQRIDVFSYAVTCYEMWSKKTPWVLGDSLEATLEILTTPPKRLAKYNPEVPEKIEKIIMKGLRQDPEKRWQTVGQMTKAFRRCV